MKTFPKVYSVRAYPILGTTYGENLVQCYMDLSETANEGWIEKKYNIYRDVINSKSKSFDIIIKAQLIVNRPGKATAMHSFVSKTRRGRPR